MYRQDNNIQSFANILLFHPLQLLHPLCRIQLFANIFLLHPLQLLYLLRRQDNTVTCKYSYYCCTRCNCCICCVGKIIQSLANNNYYCCTRCICCVGKIIQSFVNILLFHPLQLLHPLLLHPLHPLQLLYLLRRQDNTVICKYI